MYNYNHDKDFNVNSHDAWYSRQATLENLFETVVAVARGFIIANRPQLADEILATAEDAKDYFADKYHIKVWDGGEIFTTLKSYKPEKIKMIAKNTDSAKVYLHEFESFEGGEEYINLAIIIDRTNGEEL